MDTIRIAGRTLNVRFDDYPTKPISQMTAQGYGSFEEIFARKAAHEIGLICTDVADDRFAILVRPVLPPYGATSTHWAIRLTKHAMDTLQWDMEKPRSFILSLHTSATDAVAAFNALREEG